MNSWCNERESVSEIGEWEWVRGEEVDGQTELWTITNVKYIS